jgi:hypothetical protein
VEPVFGALEGNQAHAAIHVKLNNVAPVVESFVAVRRPKKIARTDQIARLVPPKTASWRVDAPSAGLLGPPFVRLLLAQGLLQQSFDYGLPADIEAGSPLIELS